MNLEQPSPVPSSFMKNKARKYVESIISDTPYNREFREKVFKALVGDYTEEDILRAEQEQRELLEQIEREMENKECIQATESKVFLGTAEQISQQYIDDNPV